MTALDSNKKVSFTLPADRQFRSLPDGWRWVRLGEVCEINTRRPELARKNDSVTTFVPMSAVDQRLGTIVRAETKPFGHVRKGYTYFEDGDVLFAKITPCMQNGKHAIARNLAGGFGFGTTEFHVLRPGPTITPEWIHFFIRQPEVLENAKAHFAGAVGQQRVPETYLADLDIPLPPLEEQKRIAAILNEQMAAVERARAAAESQLEAAKALPAAYLRAVFDSSESQNWPMRRLGDILLETRNGLYKPEEYYGRGTRILKMYNIGRLDGTWNLERVDHIQLSEEEKSVYSLSCGDLMLNRVNSRELVGKCAVVDDSVAGCVFESKNMRLRMNPKESNPYFTATWLNSAGGRSQMEDRLKQIVGQATVNRSDLDTIKIPLPPLAVQQRIAAMLTEQMLSVGRTRKAIGKELDTINKLPAALLRRAFRGEL